MSAVVDAEAGISAPRTTSKSDFEIQSLLKGLRIIEAINNQPGMIVAQIAALLGLPRTTAHRALRTMEQHQYIYRDPATGGFFVNTRVRALACGIDPVAEMTIRVRGEFERIGASVRWPMHFSTPVFESAAPQIRVQASTDFVSPLAVDKLLPGASIPLLQCAAGLVCLADLADPQFHAVIHQALDAPCAQASQVRWTIAALEEQLQRVRRDGFAIYRWAGRRTNMVGLSVPLRRVGCSAAALSVRFAESAVSVRDGQAQFLPLLRALAQRLSAPDAALCRDGSLSS